MCVYALCLRVVCLCGVCMCACVCGVIQVWGHHHRVIVVRVLTTGVDLLLNDRFESVRTIHAYKDQDTSLYKVSEYYIINRVRKLNSFDTYYFTFIIPKVYDLNDTLTAIRLFDG